MCAWSVEGSECFIFVIEGFVCKMVPGENWGRLVSCTDKILP